MLDWPAGLTPGTLPPSGYRPASAVEHRAAEAILGLTCQEHQLVPARSTVARLRRPERYNGSIEAVSGAE
jgi:hypothetical protein